MPDDPKTALDRGPAREPTAPPRRWLARGLGGSLVSGLRLRPRWRLLVRRATHSRIRNYPYTRAVIAALAGSLAGLGVVMLRDGIDAFHSLVFQIPEGSHLSDAKSLPPYLLLLVPPAGGVVVGCANALIRRWRPGDIVDAIEANALHGGRMSMVDSLNLALLTLLSGGFGASVGLEAAYTQLGASIFSKFGRALRLRREDLRTLVGCGAAAAIAAAFNAPLTGAFYAFELILGSYTLATLIPVTIAALAGTFTARATFGSEPIFVIEQAMRLRPGDYVAFLGLRLGAAAIAIATMQGVTATEALLRRWIRPRLLAPAVGGLALGLLALLWPQVLGSGHGAILYNLRSGSSLPYFALLLCAKIAASAISIGSGFRGGLFSASLFIGCLFGNAAALLLGHLIPWFPIDPLPYALVGMGAVAAGIVGAPVTMILLVLESTGDFTATVGVMIGVLTATAIVREAFGYSFATWRFHLRGLKISSPEDVGWIDELTVARLMRGDPKVVSTGLSVASLRKLYPLGSTKQLFAADEGKLEGLIDLADLHASDRDVEAETLTVSDIMHPLDTFLVPADNLRIAMDRFHAAALETLPVVDNAGDRHIVGYLSEAYVLRRYSQELERRQGRSSLFAPATELA